LPSRRSAPARPDPIAAALADPIGAILAGSILGTTDPAAMRREIEAFSFLPVRLAPTAEESQLFVEEYEAARETPFTGEGRRAVDAAIVYTLAYVARCEHASGRRDLEGSFREALAQVGDSLLR